MIARYIYFIKFLLEIINIYSKSKTSRFQEMAASTNDLVDVKSSSCKVLIIGAGMAGLSAANHLLKNAEPDFLIVEARSRIGGRIFAVSVGK